MVRVRGVHGFGFIHEIVYCAGAGVTVFIVDITLHNDMREAQRVTLAPDDCMAYHSAPSSAAKVYAHQDEHEHALMDMAA